MHSITKKTLVAVSALIGLVFIFVYSFNFLRDHATGLVIGAIIGYSYALKSLVQLGLPKTFAGFTYAGISCFMIPVTLLVSIQSGWVSVLVLSVIGISIHKRYSNIEVIDFDEIGFKDDRRK